MSQVRHLLQTKGSTIFSVAPDAPVLEAIKRMAEHRIGALLVLANDELVGVVSERDYARKVILQGKSSSQTAVSDIMSGTPITVGPDTDVFDCMRLCTDSRIRHLPVVEGGKLVGVISIGDLVKAVIDEQARELEHLHRYVSG
jgi:CBS domain-containing protein